MKPTPGQSELSLDFTGTTENEGVFFFFGVNNSCNKHVTLELPRHVRKA